MNIFLREDIDAVKYYRLSYCLETAQLVIQAAGFTFDRPEEESGYRLFVMAASHSVDVLCVMPSTGTKNSNDIKAVIFLNV